MIKEAIILATCIQGNGGCSESYSAYYQEQPAFRDRIEYFERWTESVAGKEMLRIYGPVFLLAAGKEGTIKLTRNWAFSGTLISQKLEYKYEF